MNTDRTRTNERTKKLSKFLTYLDNCRYEKGSFGIIWPSTEVGQSAYDECSTINGTKLKGNVHLD